MKEVILLLITIMLFWIGWELYELHVLFECFVEAYLAAGM